ncbi:PLP-dependent aminotransferase family protein [Paenibacillus sp. N1-5-1-14]|uniref:MocR-like pyridoxine biosynthesis transcription factor PdxR n=1 Tax=Paenibacillus radicibacter TaxID=2972488 RepID=UPI002159A577|nr:PLP-dependent aminotransferase family protein [Paenibacillus radicibacter]MCR8645996.1 PLP-dependent aminotransferase family protein [Paenibacillus radicibacter]
MVWMTLDRTLPTTLTRQVFNQLQTKIFSGELVAGSPLPSTRQLAGHLHVSRNVILEAYDQLMAEGYLESKQGSGTYVAEGLLLEQSSIPEQSILTEESISKSSNENQISFRSGIPALDLFPRKIWSQLTQQVLVEAPSDSFGYGSPEGRYELRSAIAQYVLRTRGVRCEPNQLVITSGATQGITLVAKLLVKPGEDFMIEDPITNDIQTIFRSHGANLVPLPVDEHGIDTSLMTQGHHHGSVYVTPSHQYPLGAVLPIQRKVQLIENARQTGNYIIEDDYDSEFRYEGSPIRSLQGLDPNVVIYLGTFSKILSPALRIGYMVLPRPLIEQCRSLKWFSDLHTPSMEQLTLARFIEERHLERHIHRMKKVYKQRRDIVKQTLKSHFGEEVRVTGDTTGLHLIAEFKHIRFTEEVLDRIHHADVLLQPVEMHANRKGNHVHRIILGFGHLSSAEIEEGIRRLRSIL